MLLDKASKKVLNYVINLYKDNGGAINSSLKGQITFMDHDINALGFDSHALSLICENLKNKGYFSQVTISLDEYITVWISHNALTYCEYEKQKLFFYWFPIIIDAVLSVTAIIISIIALNN